MVIVGMIMSNFVSNARWSMESGASRTHQADLRASLLLRQSFRNCPMPRLKVWNGSSEPVTSRPVSTVWDVLGCARSPQRAEEDDLGRA